MRNRFDRQLETLNDEMIEMGSLICRAIEMAVDALLNKNLKTAKETIAFDLEIDHKERDIESICMKLLLQQQPVARDLRLISSALKMITDMERIGDQAADIAEITVSMAEVGGTIDLAPIQEMSAITMQMVEKSIGAFVNKDDELATKVIYMDDQVDDCFDSIKTQIIKLINKNTEVGEKATDILMIAKYLERIGDHATNIADWVVYSIRGKHEKGNE